MAMASSEEFVILCATVDRLFTENLDRARIAAAEDGRFDADLWHLVEAAGLTRVHLPEALGGAGYGWRCAGAVLRLAGRHALPLPLAETMVAVWALSEAGFDGAIPSGPLALAPCRDPDDRGAGTAAAVSADACDIPGAGHAFRAEHSTDGVNRAVAGRAPGLGDAMAGAGRGGDATAGSGSVPVSGPGLGDAMALRAVPWARHAAALVVVMAPEDSRGLPRGGAGRRDPVPRSPGQEIGIGQATRIGLVGPVSPGEQPAHAAARAATFPSREAVASEQARGAGVEGHRLGRGRAREVVVREQAAGVAASGGAAWRITRLASNLAGEARDDLLLPGNTLLRLGPRRVDLASVWTHLALARSAQLVGALEASLDLALRYAGERVQFGRPIGRFQAVQQELARFAGQVAAAGAALEAALAAADRGEGERPASRGEAQGEEGLDRGARLPELPAAAVRAIELGQIRAQLAAALGALESGDPTFEIAVAKIVASDAASAGAAIAHQVHGAIGFTAEHPLQHLTRRLWAWRAEAGRAADWAELLGEATLRAGPEALWPRLTAR